MRLGVLLCPWKSLAYFATSIGLGPLGAYTTKLLADVVDSLVGIVSGAGNAGTLWHSLGMSAALTVAAALITALVDYLRNSIPLNISKAVSLRIVSLASSVPYFEYLTPEYHGAAGAASDNAIYSANGVLGYSADIITAVSAMISYAVMLASFGGTIAAVCAVLLVCAACYVNVKVQEKQRSERSIFHMLDDRKDYYNNLYVDKNAMYEMALFGTDEVIDPSMEDYYNRSVQLRKEQQLQLSRLNIALNAIQALIAGAGMVAVIVGSDLISAGALTAIIVAMKAVTSSATQAGSSMGKMLSYRRSMEDFLVFEDKYKRTDKVNENVVMPDMQAAAVDAEHVSFAYGDNVILRDISIHIEKGEHVAIVGENGAGKSTLINILLGLYPNGGGKVRIFGADPEALLLNGKKLPAYALFQTYGKFYGLTVGENITLGCAKFDAERAGRIDPFLGSIDPETITGESLFVGGEDFSGGEWQKIALARCSFAPEAPLVILDEPTASLDPVAEMQIFNNAMKEFAERAVILITHRLGAVRHADRIYVMRDGMFTEQGTHDELMAENGYYAAMFNEQAAWYTTGKGDGQ